jgi:quinoprotein glucose dehydrogenase
MSKNLLCFLVLKSILLFNTNLLSQDKNETIWPYSNGDYNSHKYSTLDQINKSNISSLKKIWVFKSGFVPKDKTNNQLTPIFTGSSLITTSLDGFVVSLNPISGKEFWRTKLTNPVAKRGVLFSKKYNSIFVPTKKGVVALNEKNGKVQTKIGKDGRFGSSISLLSPILDNENLFIPFTNKIESYSIRGDKNWSLDLNGARVWSGFSYDKENKIILAVTSNLINLWGKTIVNPDFANSLILIDSISGKVKCKFKDVRHDHWDLDIVSSPIIIEDKKLSNKNAYAFSKTGNIIVVNINECKLKYEDSVQKIKTKIFDEINITNNLKKFSQTYSPYQYKFLKPTPLLDQRYFLDDYLSTLNDEENIEYLRFKTRNAKYGEYFIPLSLDYDVIMYGLHGGPSWSGGTYDINNHQIIIQSNHYPWILRSFYYDRLYNKLNKKYSSIKKKFKVSKVLEKNYISPWEKKDQNKEFKSFYSKLPKLFDQKGWEIYNAKCQSCHGSTKEGKYEGESAGGAYIPSLIGLSFNDKKFASMKNLETFNKSHKYINKKVNLTTEELDKLKKYFSKHDRYLKRFNLLGIYGKWQLFLDKYNLPASAPPWGKISAINLLTGKINWSVPSGFRKKNGKKIIGDINFGGVMSTAGDILFATGTPDKYVRAYNSKNGEVVWEYELPAAGSAAPMSFMHQGEQYLIINASGGRFYGYEKKLGDYIVAFKLER